MLFQRWSEHLWTTLHFMSLQCDITNDKTNISFIEKLLNTLHEIMDCEICRNHYKDYISKHPVKSPYFEWIVDLHNEVNVLNHKEKLDINEIKIKYQGIINSSSHT